MKRQLAIGLLISALALWLSMRDVNFPRMLQALGQARYVWLVPAMAFTMLGYLVRAYRWKFLLMPVKNVRTASLFSATIIGFFANIVLPARLGEIVRPYVIGRRESMSKTASFATIVVERVFDLTTLMLCFVVVLLLYPQSFPTALREAGVVMFGTNLVALAVLLLLQMRTAAFLRLVQRVLRPFPPQVAVKIVTLLGSFAEGLAVLRSGHHLARISFLSIVMWLTIVLSIWTTLLGTRLGDLPLYASAVLVVVISVGIMLPSAPGYIGVMQVACVLGLRIFGVDSTTALTFSWLYLVTQHIPVLASGLYFMWLENLSLGEMSRVGVSGAKG